MPGANSPSVKHIVEPERILDANTKSAVPLLCEYLLKPIHNGSMIYSNLIGAMVIICPSKSSTPVVLGQDSCFGELMILRDTEFPALDLDRH